MITNQAVRDDVKALFKVSIDDLEPMQGNLKDLSTENFEKLRRQILDRGFSAPFFVWDDGESYKLMDGHQRLRALKQMRSEGYEIPMLSAIEISAKNEDDARGKLFGLASQFGEVTSQGLYELMNEWQIDVDQIMSDYRMPEIDMSEFKSEFFEELDTSDTDDAAPEVPKVPKSKLGDIWTLGEHRLMCGDSTSLEAVEKLMAGEKADMVFTDPPYGMHLDADYSKMGNSTIKPGRKHSDVIGDQHEFDPSVLFELFGYCKEIILFGADYYADKIPRRNSGAWLVWDKRVEKRFDKIIGSAFELVWTRTKRKRQILRHEYVSWASRMADNVEGKKPHPTMKPVGLLIEILLMTDGSLVVDLFGGSGSTLIACEKTGRRCFMSEIDPGYVDVILTRWSTFTGKDPVRDDGVTWSSLTQSV